ncbi:hypothetical protein ES702_02543 [subsurface metagenome]
MNNYNKIKQFRKHIEKIYRYRSTGCGATFDELLCWEMHEEPINPRMQWKTHSGYCTGLTFKELAEKWGISVSFLGQLIADHCRKLES